MARVPMINEESAAPGLQETFRTIRDQGRKVLNIFKVVANCPQIGLDFLRLGNSILLKGVVPPPLRELAILRVGHLCQARYEWTQHVAIALRVGVLQAQIDSLPEWEHSGEFTDSERAVLRYTDEETLNIRVKDETFAAIRAFLDEEGTVELTTAIGYYGMVCRILESLQVELE